jgi:hypothetical protein
MTHTGASSLGLPQVQAVQFHADMEGILGIGGREGVVVFFLCIPILCSMWLKMPQGRSNNHTSMHPQQTRDRKKALVKRKNPVRVYQRPDVGLKEIKRKGSDLIPRYWSSLGNRSIAGSYRYGSWQL